MSKRTTKASCPTCGRKKESPGARVCSSCYIAEQDVKNRTRLQSRDLVKTKAIKPTRCRRCGRAGWFTQIHHEDYSDPSNVQFLCQTCHGREHGKIRRGITADPLMPGEAPVGEMPSDAIVHRVFSGPRGREWDLTTCGAKSNTLTCVFAFVTCPDCIRLWAERRAKTMVRQALVEAEGTPIERRPS